MRKILPAVLALGASLFATSAFAAPTALKCAGPDLGPHYFYVWVDYDARTVSIGKQDTMTPASAVLPVTLSESEAVWVAPGGSGDPFRYVLKRDTGAISVSADNYQSGDVTCKATP